MGKGKKLDTVENEQDAGFEEVAADAEAKSLAHYLNRQDFAIRNDLRLAVVVLLAYNAAFHAILAKMKDSMPDAIPLVMEALGISEPLTSHIAGGRNVIVAGSSYSIRSHNAKAYEVILQLQLGDKEGALRSYLQIPPEAPKIIHDIARDAGLMEGNASVSTGTVN